MMLRDASARLKGFISDILRYFCIAYLKSSLDYNYCKNQIKGWIMLRYDFTFMSLSLSEGTFDYFLSTDFGFAFGLSYLTHPMMYFSVDSSLGSFLIPLFFLRLELSLGKASPACSAA